MLQPRIFRLIDEYTRTARQTPTKPFGGMQVILVGDFAQLPSILSKEDKQRAIQLTQQYGATEGDNLRYEFCFEHRLWRESITHFVYLTKVHRQADSAFVGLLNRIRLAECTEDDYALLQALTQKDPNNNNNNNNNDNNLKNTIRPTELYPYNYDVDRVNEQALMELEPDRKKHRVYFCEKKVINADSRSDVDFQRYNQFFRHMESNNLAPPELRLAIGQQVMLVANLCVSKGLANGSRGVVTKFKKMDMILDHDSLHQYLPIVHFMNGETVLVSVNTWSHTWHDSRITAEYSQIPLRPAYALSIHKSQGITLDVVRTQLKGIFEDGQAYVALSRAKTLEGLFLKQFDRQSIRVNAKVRQLYNRLAQRVQALQSPIVALTPILPNQSSASASASSSSSSLSSSSSSSSSSRFTQKERQRGFV